MYDINDITKDLKFYKVNKLPKEYRFTQHIENMPQMTYAVSKGIQDIETHTKDGYETKNTSQKGDIVISGPSKEQYVVKPEKFNKLYQGGIGNTVIPEQSPRLVAKYSKPETIQFTAPWGESMVLKQGDYIVKDGDAGYYRIAKDEYEQTYNQIDENFQRMLKLAGLTKTHVKEAIGSYKPATVAQYLAISKIMKPQVIHKLGLNADCYATENPPKITVLLRNQKLYIELETGVNGAGKCKAILIRRTGLDGATHTQEETYDFSAKDYNGVAEVLINNLVFPTFNGNRT